MNPWMIGSNVANVLRNSLKSAGSAGRSMNDGEAVGGVGNKKEILDYVIINR